MTPTIASLMKVAAALGKSVAYFVEEAERRATSASCARDERAQVYTSKQGLELRNVSGRYGPFFDRRRRRGRRAARRQRADADEPSRRGARDRARGRDGFTVDGEHYELREGDSIHFRTRPPHSWRNPTDAPGAGDLAGGPLRL